MFSKRLVLVISALLAAMATMSSAGYPYTTNFTLIQTPGSAYGGATPYYGLAPGRSIYLYVYVSDGTMPFTGLSTGQFASVKDSAGAVIGGIALTSRQNETIGSYQPGDITPAHGIQNFSVAGAGIYNYSSYNITYATNSTPGANSVSDTFTVTKPGSMTVLLLLTNYHAVPTFNPAEVQDVYPPAYETYPPAVQNDGVPLSMPGFMEFVSYLNPGTYTVTENTSSNHVPPGWVPGVADLMAVLTFTPGNSTSAVLPPSTASNDTMAQIPPEAQQGASAAYNGTTQFRVIVPNVTAAQKASVDANLPAVEHALFGIGGQTALPNVTETYTDGNLVFTAQSSNYTRYRVSSTNETALTAALDAASCTGPQHDSCTNTNVTLNMSGGSLGVSGMFPYMYVSQLDLGLLNSGNATAVRNLLTKQLGSQSNIGVNIISGVLATGAGMVNADHVAISMLEPLTTTAGNISIYASAWLDKKSGLLLEGNFSELAPASSGGVDGNSTMMGYFGGWKGTTYVMVEQAAQLASTNIALSQVQSSPQTTTAPASPQSSVPQQASSSGQNSGSGNAGSSPSLAIIGGAAAVIIVVAAVVYAFVRKKTPHA